MVAEKMMWVSRAMRTGQSNSAPVYRRQMNAKHKVHRHCVCVCVSGFCAGSTACELEPDNTLIDTNTMFFGGLRVYAMRQCDFRKERSRPA